MKDKRKILFLDIETGLSQAYLFRSGEQVIRHNQLVPGFNLCDIICVSYMWVGDTNVKTICVDPENQKESLKSMIEQIDKIAEQANAIIGKNNVRFDDKHLNTLRLLSKSKPAPWWAAAQDDLEKQVRKYFAFHSNSLDYISEILGYGGKQKMEFDDWVKISQYLHLNRLKEATNWVLGPAHTDSICKELYNKDELNVFLDGEQALKKMVKYNKKDVRDTRDIFLRVDPYVKFKCSQREGAEFCKHCAEETKSYPNGSYKTRNNIKYNQYYCTECKKYKYSIHLTPKGKESILKKY